MVEHLLLSQRTGVRVPAPTWMLTTVTSVLGDSTLSGVQEHLHSCAHTPSRLPKHKTTKSHSILGLPLSGESISVLCFSTVKLG